MNHECAMPAYDACASAEVSDNARGRYGPYVVNGERNWEGAEYIIYGYAVWNRSSRCLENHVDVRNLVAGGYGDGVADTCHGGLIYGASENAIDFISRLGRLGYGSIGHVVSQMNRLRQ